MIDYIDIASIDKNVEGYLRAFKVVQNYCRNVEPWGDEYHNILPLKLRPTFGNGNESFRKDANYLSTTHAHLLDFGKARFLAKGYWDYDSFFKVSWQLHIPIDIYGWQRAIITYPDGYDDDNNPIGEPKHTPPIMKLDNPKYVQLGELSGWAMKSWALPDWWAKHDEIESFMDDNPQLKDKYREAVAKADKEVKEWQSALEDMNKLTKIFSK